MKNKLFLTGILIILVALTQGFAPLESTWSRTGSGIIESKVDVVGIPKDSSSSIYVGTERALYFSSNPQGNFKEVFRLQSKDKTVNDIHFSIVNPGILYVATDSGLYKSTQVNHDLKKVFDPNDLLAKQCLAVADDADKIYLGTLKGLFFRSSLSHVWKKAKGVLGKYAVFSIEVDKNYIYATTTRELYRSRKDNLEYKRIFSLNVSGEAIIEEDILQDISREGLKKIKAVNVTDGVNAGIVIATTSGIYKSSDYGENWQRISSDGLPLNEVTSLLVMEHQSDASNALSKLIVGTGKGVFLFDGNGWLPLYKGMSSSKINDLAIDKEGNVYSATEDGVFFIKDVKALSSTSPIVSISYSEIEKHFSSEPSVREAQKLAIKYAEVSPDKIKNWRRLAQKRAWLPNISVGVDSDWDRSVSDSVYGSYTSGGQYFIAPDDKTSGQDFGWDVSLSWDLSDLVWSTDQTTIDSRSKMMVELREDILDQITRLYFERRRIQVELLAMATSLESQIVIDKRMRIEELTALIDALTGGEFSRRVRRQDLITSDCRGRRKSL